MSRSTCTIWRCSCRAIAGDDGGIWQRAGRGQLSGAAVAVPSPTDQLFITLAHALLYGPEPSGDWMLDAAALIGAGGIDWALIEAEAARRAMEPSIAVPLAFLAEATGLPIPRDRLVRMTRRFRDPFIEDFICHATGYRPGTAREAETARRRRGRPRRGRCRPQAARMPTRDEGPCCSTSGRSCVPTAILTGIPFRQTCRPMR